MRRLKSINNSGGFTVVEMAVAMAILSIVFGVAMMIFAQVVQTTNRAHIANLVRAEASYALSQMTRAIQKGERFDENTFSVGTDASTLTLYDSEKNCQVEFSLDPLTPSSVVMDNGCTGSFVNLNSDQVHVARLEFSRPTENKVRVELEVEQWHAPGTFTGPEYKGEITLKEEVALRNYAGYQ